MFEELRSIQAEYGYLPAEQLSAVALRLNLPVSQIHAVASFYPHFHLSPPPPADVRVCCDMTCHLYGADQNRADLAAEFHNDPGVSVRSVSCLGRCDSAPAISVNDHIYCPADRASAAAFVRDALAGRLQAPPPPPASTRELVCDPYAGTGKYEILRQLVQTRDFTGIIATLKAGGLRGMGGAGFPTGAKWEIVRNAPGTTKYIVCNADESEPGTIKDRFIMENLPYMLIEGMIVAGLVTGAKQGILYIRHEYEHQKEVLQAEIERCYQQQLLGPGILGGNLSFDLKIFVSPGGYICGEESALLEAIEGKRAEPRNKPPFPGTNGLWNQPTAINNVETFTFATLILLKGVEWFRAQGKNGCAGPKFVGISGDVVRPGVFEVPMGSSYRELIFEYAGGISRGRTLLGFAPSGPSSGYLPAAMVDLPLDWDAVQKAGSMVGSGAIVVCADDRCMLDMALNAVRFFRNESCGKCVPCRMGSQKLVEMLTRWTEGTSSQGDISLLDELTAAMKLTSICGLGQVVPVPIASVLKHFRDVIDQHLMHLHCPTGVCPMGGGAAR